MDTGAIACYAVEQAAKKRAFAAEAYVIKADATELEIVEQNVETMKFANDIGVGIRVISNTGQIGFAYTTSFEKSSIIETVERTLINCSKASGDPYNGLPTRKVDISANLMTDQLVQSMTIEDKIQLAKNTELAAISHDNRIKRGERVMYQDMKYDVAIVNSNGVTAEYQTQVCGLSAVVLAEENGEIQRGMALQYSRCLEDLKVKQIGQEAADNATRLLGAQRIPTVKAAILLSPFIAANMFSIMVPSVCADSVQKGKSLLRDKLNQKIVSPLISLIDDGTLNDGIASSPVDGEGVISQQTRVIIDGVLNQYLHNSYTAQKYGVLSTGNGIRHSFKSLPEVGATNIYVKPGEQKAADIIKNTQTGFYVTNVMGIHTANTITGDFSLAADGIWISSGEFAGPVRGVAIAGNILDLFSKVDGIGDDLRFFGSRGAPTMRISEIMISGS